MSDLKKNTSEDDVIEVLKEMVEAHEKILASWKNGMNCFLIDSKSYQGLCKAGKEISGAILRVQGQLEDLYFLKYAKQGESLIGFREYLKYHKCERSQSCGFN